MTDHFMISDNTDITNLVIELQMAREQSVLGQYTQSLESFQIIMRKIQFQIKANLSN